MPNRDPQSSSCASHGPWMAVPTCGVALASLTTPDSCPPLRQVVCITLATTPVPFCYGLCLALALQRPLLLTLLPILFPTLSVGAQVYHPMALWPHVLAEKVLKENGIPADSPFLPLHPTLTPSPIGPLQGNFPQGGRPGRQHCSPIASCDLPARPWEIHYGLSPTSQVVADLVPHLYSVVPTLWAASTCGTGGCCQVAAPLAGPPSPLWEPQQEWL